MISLASFQSPKMEGEICVAFNFSLNDKVAHLLNCKFVKCSDHTKRPLDSAIREGPLRDQSSLMLGSGPEDIFIISKAF